MARLDTSVLIAVPNIPFSSDHNVSDLVHFTSALRNAVESVRVACDDTHSIAWTRGWEKVLERHILRSVRTASPQAPQMKTLVVNAFAQGGKLLDDGAGGPDAFDLILRILCRGLSRASPAAVMQTLQFSVVAPSTPFSTYLGELRLLLSKVRCTGPVAPEDGTLQVAIKTSIHDQYVPLSAQIFAGRNMRTVPFDTVDDLMRALDDLSLNQSVASPSSRMHGGGNPMVTRSKTYARAFHSQRFGGVMEVNQREEDLADKDQEFERVYMVLQNIGGFGRDSKEPAF